MTLNLQAVRFSSYRFKKDRYDYLKGALQNFHFAALLFTIDFIIAHLTTPDCADLKTFYCFF